MAIPSRLVYVMQYSIVHCGDCESLKLLLLLRRAFFDSAVVRCVHHMQELSKSVVEAGVLDRKVGG